MPAPAPSTTSSADAALAAEKDARVDRALGGARRRASRGIASCARSRWSCPEDVWLTSLTSAAGRTPPQPAPTPRADVRASRWSARTYSQQRRRPPARPARRRARPRERPAAVEHRRARATSREHRPVHDHRRRRRRPEAALVKREALADARSSRRRSPALACVYARGVLRSSSSAPKRAEAAELEGRGRRDARSPVAQPQRRGAAAAQATTRSRSRSRTSSASRRRCRPRPTWPGILLELSRIAEETGIELQVDHAAGRPRSSATLPDACRSTLTFDGNFYELSDFLFRLRTLVGVARRRAARRRPALRRRDDRRSRSRRTGFPELAAEPDRRRVRLRHRRPGQRRRTAGADDAGRQTRNAATPAPRRPRHRPAAEASP